MEIGKFKKFNKNIVAKLENFENLMEKQGGEIRKLK